MRVLKEAYRYFPLSFIIHMDNGDLPVLIPFMEVRSRFTGVRGVSLPFTDYCPPLLDDRVGIQQILDHILSFAVKAGWRFFEIRDLPAAGMGSNPSSSYLRHTLSLSGDENRLLAGFRSNTRRNIKKAAKEGIEVHQLYTMEGVDEFARLNTMTRRDHGLPPQPKIFFRKLYDYVISKGHGFVMLASINGRNIAGAVYLHFRDQAIYKYGASDRRYQHLRANNQVMWEAIKWYSQNGYGTLCFGRTEPGNEGLRQFKTGWGTTEETINYYHFSIAQRSFISKPSMVMGWHNQLFRRMPIPALNLMGSLLYRHLG